MSSTAKNACLPNESIAGLIASSCTRYDFNNIGTFVQCYGRPEFTVYRNIDEIVIYGYEGIDRSTSDDLIRICTYDIFAVDGERLQIVEEMLDECVLCNLCVDAAPQGTVRIIKKYE